MANNRLYIYDPETNEAFMLLKSFGDGWKAAPRGFLDVPLDTHDLVLDNPLKRLERFVRDRDPEASYGNCLDGATRLQLLAECQLPPDVRFPDEDLWVP